MEIGLSVYSELLPQHHLLLADGEVLACDAANLLDAMQYSGSVG
jgi:hypothetical protein